VREVQLIIDTCKSIRSDVMVLCHGGPIANPKDAQYLFNNCTALDGFYGASSMERLPTEHAITEEIRKFAGLKLRAPDTDGHSETGVSSDGHRTNSLTSPRLGS
jgi:predicted TIM-barrel enzyme